MKKFALLIGAVAAVALLGAGCAQEPTAPEQGAAANANANANTPAFGGDQTTSNNTNAPLTIGELKEMPALAPLTTPIDDSTWITTTMRSGVVLKTPSKTALTPTSWTYTLLDSSDSHLKGDCYVTANTVYTKTSFSGFENVCQTTTELNAGPSERTDYFVFHTGKQTQLFTFIKKYPAGFDMNAYSATIEHIIGLIK
jgi:hypothetical protein